MGFFNLNGLVSKKKGSMATIQQKRNIIHCSNRRQRRPEATVKCEE